MDSKLSLILLLWHVLIRLLTIVLPWLSDTHQFRDADKVLSGFCSSCLQTPLLCPLAKNYTSAADLEDAIYKELDSLKDNPINASGTNFTYDYFKGDVLQSVLIETKYWTVLAYILNSLFTKDIPSLAKLSHMVTSSSSNPLTTNQQLSELGIQCSDKTLRASELNQVTPYMSASRSLSKVFGDMNDGSIATCAQWKMPAKEQYNGSFHIKTPTPFLLIGNSFDPLTPLSSAHNVSAGLEGSVVLQQNGYGVSTNSHSSDISPICVCVGTTWLIYFVFRGNSTHPLDSLRCARGSMSRRILQTAAFLPTGLFVSQMRLPFTTWYEQK